MGYCKVLLFIITFILLCSGIFGHPFQRHLKAISPTAAATVKSVELNNFYNELASDESIGVQDGTNVNLTGYGDIELELHGELEFKICTKGCMEKQVAVCYDSNNVNPNAKCSGSTQCEFRGGVTTVYDLKQIWFMHSTYNEKFVGDMCKTAVMKNLKADAFGGIPSCYPTKHDGNVVKLYVKTATRECPLIVVGAKIWHLPTAPPTPTPELPTEKPTSSKPPPSSSTSDSSNTLWIVIGVVSGILVIALIIGLGCLIYHRCIKKKSAAVTNADGKNVQILTDTKPLTEVQTPIVKQETEKEKVVEEGKKSGVQEKVTTTKEETEEPKPKKKKAAKRKSKKQKKSKKEKKAAPPPAPKAPTPNRTKPTQEESPPNATGPAFEDTVAQSVVSQESAAPTPCVSASKDEVKKRRPSRGHLGPRTGKLVEYNQKSALDAPNSFDESSNGVRMRAPPLLHGLRRAKAKKEKLVEQESTMEKM